MASLLLERFLHDSQQAQGPEEEIPELPISANRDESRPCWMCKTHQANIKYLTARVDALKGQLTGTKSQSRPGSFLSDIQSHRYRALAQEVQNGRKEIDKLREAVCVSKRHVGKLQKENAELKQSASASTERKLHEKVIRLQAQLREYHRGEGDIESSEGLQDQLLEAHSELSSMAFTLNNERLSVAEKDQELEELKVKLLETTGRLEALSREKRETEAALETLREQARLREEEIENSQRCRHEAGCEDDMEHLTQPLEPLQSDHMEEPTQSKQQAQAEQHRQSQDEEVAVVLGELRIQAVRRNEDEEKRRELALVEADRVRLVQERSEFYLERASAKKSLEAWESQLSALSQHIREGLAAVPPMPRSSGRLTTVSGQNPVASDVLELAGRTGSDTDDDRRKSVKQIKGGRRLQQLPQRPVREQTVKAGRKEASVLKRDWDTFWKRERDLLKQTFEDLHGKVEGKVAKCQSKECQNRTSSFCEGCQLAFCTKKGATCFAKHHQILYLDVLREAEEKATTSFQKKRKS